MLIVQTDYESLHHTLPDIFNNYSQKRNNMHEHNTINCHKLHVTRARTNLDIRGAGNNELSYMIITKSPSPEQYKIIPFNLKPNL